MLLRGSLLLCTLDTPARALRAAAAATRTASAAAARASAAMSTPSSKAAAPNKRRPSTPKKQLVPNPNPDPALVSKALKIAAQLQQLYPEPAIPLDHASPFQLLVAVMLSAQTTDKKVNEVTPELNKLAPDAASLAAQDVAVVQRIIAPIGLAPTKAKNLVAMAQLLLERHSGAVPSSFEELEALPGVGHKTASVIMAQAFGVDAFPVDTHIHRLAQRWGLSSGKSVEQTEADLKSLLPQHTWREAHLQIIYFGREHCPAKSHDPKACPICSWAASAGSSKPASAGSSKPASAASAAARKKGGKRTAAEAAAGAVAAEVAAAAASDGDAAAAARSGRRRRRA